MTDSDPVLAVWVHCDPSMPEWSEAKKAVEAYRVGDLVTATSRMHLVLNTWGQSWAELSDALWEMHAEPEVGPKRPEGKLRRGLRGVWDFMDALDVAVNCLAVMVALVALLVASGIGLFHCIRDALP